MSDLGATDNSQETASQVTGKPMEKVSNGKRRRAGLILMILAVTGVFIGVKWFINSQTRIATDNAFIESHIFSISSRIPGHVLQVHVKDNQFVRKGDLLLEIDPSDYELRAKQAVSALAVARNEASGDYAQVEIARAEEARSRARLDQAELDLTRAKALFDKEVIPREQLDRVSTARRVAAAQLKEAEEKVKKAQSVLGLTGSGLSEAKVAQKEAQLAENNLVLSYAKIFAPADGYITRKSVEPGNNIQTGQPVMALVRLDDAWITANYKERQLTHVHPGMKVEFKVDTYPGHVFKGVVDSVMAGTGAAFSLLPPENATGNYVKVVQRIPVKIAIDQASDPEHLLRIGMSVVPTIHIDRTFSELLKELFPFLP